MKTALISVYDKKGIVDFAKDLVDLGWEIVSTGGTYEELKSNGIEVISIEDLTNFPEILDGRVKTLNPYIHGGLLYKRDDESHVETMGKMDIKKIDMVINNLYPFEEKLKKENISHDDLIENIDIGGPSMIRAGAKNYKFLTVIVDPEDYNKVLDELKSHNRTSLETRRYLARKVFNYTAFYDSLISDYFNEIDQVDYPDYKTLAYKRNNILRYGENPHQSGAFYKQAIDIKGTIGNGAKLHGKDLSFNNINDGNAAINIVKDFQEPSVAALKHANPCGIGSGGTLLEAYEKAYECDKESIFGGIIAVNRELGEDLAREINKIFIEVLIAPSFTKEAMDILTKKKNIRLIEVKDLDYKNKREMDYKKVSGGILVQEKDSQVLNGDLDLVTDRAPSEEEMEDLKFAWKAVKNTNSNAIVIAKDKGTIGLGLGEVNRFWAVENAIQRAGDQVSGSVLASDGFFPFKDSIEILGKYGVTAIIQPGGSKKDPEVIEEANKHNIAMVFTGIRHFKH